VYTNLHPGGNKPSYGIFTPLTRGKTLTDIVSLIVKNINDLQIDGITAAPSGSKIIITGAQVIECTISSDVRVGQPSNIFCSKCCWCCGRRIGRVTAARLDVDAALVQLDPGLKYKAEIENIGVVSGTYQVTEPDAISGRYQVRKRGWVTGLTTSGIV